MKNSIRWWFAVLLAMSGALHAQTVAEATEENPTPEQPAPVETSAGEIAGAGNVAYGTNGMVVSVHPLATRAGLEALQRGGNAVDAVVAVGLTLGVVDQHNSGLGGGCFILMRRGDGAYHAIDGREKAPAQATRDMFLRDGKADAELSQTGALAIATPGALAAYDSALRQFGKLPLAEHLEAAARIAEEGFPLDRAYASKLRGAASTLAKFEGSRAALLKADGAPYARGEILKQPDLARTYRGIATHGTGWFYGGPFAEATEKWMKENGGLLTIEDFKNYTAPMREPVLAPYRGYIVASMPPPSSGGVHVAQMLRILETREVKALRGNAADVIHLITETMKLAFADRAHWLGDPDFVKVPRGLIDKKYTQSLAAKIDMEKASEVPGHGTPDRATEDVFAKHTTHFSAVDGEGNWVACTATVNTSFGSKVVIPGTGVVMNNEMDDFAAQPGVPNYFGLLGAEANAVAPGKRPLSSMTPTIVSKGDQPVLMVGAAGGPTIISQVLLAIVNFIDFNMPLRDALMTPRFHHQWQPDELRIEKKWADSVMAGLETRGHKLRKLDSMGACQAIARSGDGGMLMGCPDPRGSGKAEGF